VWGTRLWLRTYGVDRLMSYLVGLMVYTIFVAFLSVLVAQHFMDRWEGAHTGHMVAEVLFDDVDNASVDRAMLVTALRKRLDSLPEVKSYKFIQTESVDLARLAPDFMVEPIFIDISVRARTLSAQQMQSVLVHVCPTVKVRAPLQKKEASGRLVRIISLMGVALIALIVFGAIVVIAFASQTSLMINRRIIAIMSSMGATPIYISRQFQRHTWRLGGQGALLGLTGIVLTLLALYCFLARCDYDINDIFSSGSLISLLFGVPLCTVILMVLSVDVVVRQSLSDLQNVTDDWA